MKISVIISCHNSATTLPAQLEALSGQSWDDDWEMIVVDNGSRDRSVSIAKKFKHSIPRLRVYQAVDRKGFAHARNAAVRKSSGDVLLFCDGDDIVGNRWLTTMGNALRENVFVAGRLLVTEINKPWTIDSRPEDLNFQNAGVVTAFGYLPWASSSNMGIHRSLFNDAGGFDESMTALEDIDFSWRVQRLGERVVPVEDSFVHYRLRRTCIGIFHQAFLFAENFALLKKRYEPLGLSPSALPRGSRAGEWILLWLRLFLFNRQARGAWMWKAGWRFGSWAGNFKSRAVPANNTSPEKQAIKPALPVSARHSS